MTRRGQVEVSAGFVGRARVLTGLPFYHLSYTSLPTTYLGSRNVSNTRSRHCSLSTPLQCSLGGPKWALLGQLGYQGPRRLANKMAKCPTIYVSSRISRSLSEPTLTRNGPKNKRASQREARGEVLQLLMEPIKIVHSPAQHAGPWSQYATFHTRASLKHLEGSCMRRTPPLSPYYHLILPYPGCSPLDRTSSQARAGKLKEALSVRMVGRELVV